MPTLTLQNGLRVIFEPRQTDVVYCGYVVKAGTRNEESADSGMAHFIEHMGFKGTERRRSFHINNSLERLGGDLNAFTNKQETVYYATILRDFFPNAVDILSDLMFHSVYAQAEINKEVEVICDEIESYQDSPSELIFDDFEAMLFEGSPLGRDILGRSERLREYTTSDALRFVRRWYRPDNMVFYVTGNLRWERIVDLLERHTPKAGEIPPLADRILQPSPLPSMGQRKTVDRHTHQAHVVMGAPTFGGGNPQRYALALLNNILGGPAMNSRLNMSLREHAGLVYSVDSYLTTYIDTGFWCIYFGCDGHDVARCLRLAGKELQRLIDNPLSPRQLAAAQTQLIGQLRIADANAEGYALAMGKEYAHYGTIRDTDAIVEAIRSVTAEDLHKLATEIYAKDRISTLIYA